MKRSQAFPSNYLGKDDVSRPIVATIDAVRMESVKCEHGHEDKPVMTFSADQLKPLILNNVNWQTLENAYGPDSDDWHGHPVEIFVDPSVMFGRERVGGIRLRVPAARPLDAPGAGNGSVVNHNRAQSPSPAPKPAPAAAPAPLPAPFISVLEAHAIVMEGFNKARTVAKLDEFARWGQEFDFTPDQTDEQSDAYHAAKDRLAAGLASFRRPVTA